MTQEVEKHIRENLLPKSIDLSEFDIWQFDWLEDGIEDFTGAAMKKNCRVLLVARDFRMEIKLYLNRKTT